MPHVASMTWRHGLFAHWPVDPEAIRSHLPRELTLETRDGHAWVSVLPFVLANVGLRWSPSILKTALPELNVRTYVRYRGEPGLFFFSVDIGAPLLARVIGQTTRLPVYHARMRVGADGRQVGFSSSRTDDESGWDTHVGARGESGARPPARFDATYRPAGDVFTPRPGTLAYWLTERRRFYAPENGGVLTGEIAHNPWPLQPAEATITENTMFEANGLPSPDGEPVCHYCEELAMTGSIPRRL
nr:DUF2071 domain-containing protein [Natrarchaeobius chitinivorans]